MSVEAPCRRCLTELYAVTPRASGAACRSPRRPCTAVAMCRGGLGLRGLCIRKVACIEARAPVGGGRERLWWRLHETVDGRARCDHTATPPVQTPTGYTLYRTSICRHAMCFACTHSQHFGEHHHTAAADPHLSSQTHFDSGRARIQWQVACQSRRMPRVHPCTRGFHGCSAGVL